MNGRGVIVVGAGKMGLLHGALIQASGRAHVVGIVDPSRQARLLLRGMGIRTPAYATLTRALRASPAASAAWICTPPRWHAPVAREAMAAGLHVFVEKPLSTSSAQSRELAEEAARRGLVGCVGYVRRHHAVYRRLFDEVHKRGVPSQVQTQIRSPQFADAPTGAGAHRGGLEWDLLPHALDMTGWIAGNSAAIKVEDARFRGTDRIEVTGCIGSAPVEIVTDWASRDVRKVELTVDVAFADGSALRATEDALFSIAAGSAPEVIFHRREAPPPPFDVAGAEFTHEVLDTLASMDGLATVAASLADGARVDGAVEHVLARRSSS